MSARIPTLILRVAFLVVVAGSLYAGLSGSLTHVSFVKSYSMVARCPSRIHARSLDRKSLPQGAPYAALSGNRTALWDNSASLT